MADHVSLSVVNEGGWEQGRSGHLGCTGSVLLVVLCFCSVQLSITWEIVAMFFSPVLYC